MTYSKMSKMKHSLFTLKLILAGTVTFKIPFLKHTSIKLIIIKVRGEVAIKSFWFSEECFPV